MTFSKRTFITIIVVVLLIVVALTALDALIVTDYEAAVFRRLAEDERVQGNRGPKLTQPHSLQIEMLETPDK